VTTTVVLPAYRAWATLPAVMDALRPQVERPGRELVLVESSGVVDAHELERRWPWAQVITPAHRTLPGAARNLALERSRSDLVAFIDADALPEPEWLDELERALTPEVDAVAGAVVNGTPGSAIGTSGYLLEFVEWTPMRRGTPEHGATCNLLVRRGALERLGGFPAELWPGEDTVVTFRLSERGGLAFAASARIRHLNRTRMADFVGHQYRLGVSFSEVCRQVDFPAREFTRLPLAPAAGMLRIPWLFRRLTAWDARALAPTGVLPTLLVGACSWSIGLTVGAARGMRRSG
jgi:cellulose synthase/poly-beta-1,6-N-acetylglucosamine synthase-like glycosyltransferase